MPRVYLPITNFERAYSMSRTSVRKFHPSKYAKFLIPYDLSNTADARNCDVETIPVRITLRYSNDRSKDNI